MSTLNVDTRIIRAALQRAYSECSVGNPRPLLSVLTDKSNAAFDLVSSGAVSSVTENGQTTEFDLSGPNGAPSSSVMLAIWTYLIELHERAVSALPADSDDPLIFAQICSYLRPITGYVDDWRFCRQ